MKIYDKMGREHKTVDEALAAEKEFDEAVAKAKAEKEAAAAKEKARKEELEKTRKERAKEVEDAFKAVLDAQKVYREKFDAFTRDYKGFHMTIHTGEDNPFNLFEPLFGFRGLF